MANPQVEHGHTRIANTLLEALVKADLSSADFRVLFFVIRNTYGWGRKEHRMSLNYIAAGTDLHRVTVTRSLSRLVAKRLLVKRLLVAHSLTAGYKYALQKDYELWEKDSASSETATSSDSASSATVTPASSATVTNKERTNKERKSTARTQQKTAEIPAVLPDDFSDLWLYNPEMAEGKIQKHLQKLWGNWDALLVSWLKAYPGVDIPAEIWKAHAWELSNPSKRKIDRVKFLNGWFSRTQDRGARNFGGGAQETGRGIGDRIDKGEGFTGGNNEAHG